MRDKWEFSAGPVTLGDLIDIRKAGRGDFEAMAELIKRRAVPQATDAEVRSLFGDELSTVMSDLNQSILAAGKHVVMPAAKSTTQQ